MNQLSDLRNQLHSARQRSDRLFAHLSPEGLYERAVAERHRFIFYLGHVEAFDWNLLGTGALGLPAFHPEWDQLFAFGIDPESTDLPADGPSDWPTATEVRAYGQRTREQIDAALDRAPAQLLHVAIEHRLMHLETLAYLLHNLDFGKKVGRDEPLRPSERGIANPMLPIPGGDVTLGQSAGAFGWDNEFPCHRETVQPFRIQRFKVTNGEYLRFVEHGAPAPHFWRRDGNQWKLRCMFSEIPLPLDWPVYVTHTQARAFADWRGMRLPTEAEFHCAAFSTPSGPERAYPWGDAAPTPTVANADFYQWNPCPVDANPAGASAYGIEQLVGNGWEFTSTVFAPFEGFKPFPFYPGYSANFFDGKHFVLKGGSSQTAAPLLRRSFRNWFREEYAYAFAGFRCVLDD